MRKTILRAGLLFLSFYPIISQAYEIPKQWELIPQTSIYSLINREKAQIIGTAGLSWPDGQTGIITYLKTKNDIVYRCIDWADKNFSNTGFGCYMLVNPKK